MELAKAMEAWVSSILSSAPAYGNSASDESNLYPEPVLSIPAMFPYLLCTYTDGRYSPRLLGSRPVHLRCTSSGRIPGSMKTVRVPFAVQSPVELRQDMALTPFLLCKVVAA
jgi:hypothetical protein